MALVERNLDSTYQVRAFTATAFVASAFRFETCTTPNAETTTQDLVSRSNTASHVVALVTHVVPQTQWC
jgi:hypothetical protein